MFCRQRSLNKNVRTLRPEILCQPNVPKPLHGLNPRTVMGKSWWDEVRFKAQEEFGYRCAACGVSKHNAEEHQWLEGHEAWVIDYETGKCEVTEIIPLCHYCHNFIHNGRLLAMVGDTHSQHKAKSVMEHGFSLLEGKNLKVFPGAIIVANELGADTRGVQSYSTPGVVAKWSDFHMVLEGKKYDSLYPNFNAWCNKYGA